MTRIIVDLWMPLANPDIVIEVRSHKEDGSESAIRVVRLSVTQIGENYQLPVRRYSSVWQVFLFTKNVKMYPCPNYVTIGNNYL